MSWSPQIDNQKKYVSVLGKGPTQGLEHTLTAEKIYSINFAENTKTFVWAYIKMEQIVIYLLMVHKLLHSKNRFWKCSNSITFRKHFKRILSRQYEKDWIKLGYFYDFWADYDAIAVPNILAIHRYLMKKNGIVWNVWFIKKVFNAAMAFLVVMH